jgi:hypothetical protein
MMEELFELRAYIENHNYADALALIGEMEEMSRDDKINKIESYLEILLPHLIKQDAEKRSTRSWDISIRNSVRAIQRTNKRRKAGGYYLKEHELIEAMDEVYPSALDRASLEAFEGKYNEIELAQKIDPRAIMNRAMELIKKEAATPIFKH